MTVEFTKKYVKDALVVWSSYLTTFIPLEWELTKKRLKEPEKFSNLPKEIDYMYIDTMFKTEDLSVNTINLSEWEHNLILYTDKLCNVFLNPVLKTKDFTDRHLEYIYTYYYIQVKLPAKPNELDILQSYVDLYSLNQKYNIKLPSIIQKN